MRADNRQQQVSSVKTIKPPGYVIYPIALDVVLKSASFRTYLPMEGVDSKGRTILEGRSLRFRPTTSDYCVCRFPGSRFRHEKKMNLAALKHLMKFRSETKEYFHKLSRLVCMQTQTAHGCHHDAILDLLRIAYTAYKAPQLWLLSELLSGGKSDLPPEVALAAKLSHGLFDFALYCLHENLGKEDLISPDSLYKLADAQGRLVGREEVCAGPPEIIRTFLSLALTSRVELAKSEEKKSCSLLFSLENIIDYASLCWLADMVAAVFNYLRLSTIRHLEGTLELNDHLRISFPNALTVFDLALNKRSIRDTYLIPYPMIYWFTSQTSASVSIANEFIEYVKPMLSLLSNDVFLCSTEWCKVENLMRQAVESLNFGFDSIGIFPSSLLASTSKQLELFFGPAPYTKH